MFDVPGNKKRQMQGIVSIVDAYPIFVASGYVVLKSGDHYTWSWLVPPNGMVYKLCEFHSITNPFSFHQATIWNNSVMLFQSYGPNYTYWEPASDRAASFHGMDQVQFRLGNPSYYTVSTQFRASFWREPERT